MPIKKKIIDDKIILDYSKIDVGKIEEWKAAIWETQGFREYIKYRDLQLLKELGQGKPYDQYLVLSGRRMELLSFAGDIKQAWEKINSTKKDIKK